MIKELFRVDIAVPFVVQCAPFPQKGNHVHEVPAEILTVAHRGVGFM